MTAIPSAPVDSQTATLLDAIATDRVHEDDRAKVEAAIRQVAAENGGVVSMNTVRALLHNAHGSTVHPPVIGATVSAMRHAGQLWAESWETTEGSTTRNNGKPQRRYRYTP